MGTYCPDEPSRSANLSPVGHSRGADLVSLLQKQEAEVLEARTRLFQGVGRDRQVRVRAVICQNPLHDGRKPLGVAVGLAVDGLAPTS